MPRITFFLGLFLLSVQVFAQNDAPVKVEIKKNGEQFQLLRGGQPYYIKGAGGYDHFQVLARCGGNSIRIWGHEQARDVLDEAQKLGLTVMVGLYVAHERHGFDYNDDEAVENQLNKFRNVVFQLKDHPALLMWGVGNEVNLLYKNTTVWYAVNNIAKMIHKEDPNHPAVTILAGANREDIRLIKERCPDIDALGINMYGAVASVPETIRESGWDRPYIITEWGPTGHWESETNDWQVPLEQTSTEKAAIARTRYESFLQDSEKCFGSYIFKWGNKQEMTATWYSIILETEEETGTVDVMEYLWTGKWPENVAPELHSFLLDGKSAKESPRLNKMQEYKATVKANDKDQLTYEWEVIPESKDLKEGGDAEAKPFTLDDSYKTGNTNELVFKAPRRKGKYRLFVYIRDGHNKVATANIPFMVRN